MSDLAPPILQTVNLVETGRNQNVLEDNNDFSGQHWISLNRQLGVVMSAHTYTQVHTAGVSYNYACTINVSHNANRLISANLQNWQKYVPRHSLNIDTQRHKLMILVSLLVNT